MLSRYNVPIVSQACPPPPSTRTTLCEEQIGSQFAGKHLLHELLAKGAASVNTTCCMDMEEEDEGCDNFINVSARDG